MRPIPIALALAFCQHSLALAADLPKPVTAEQIYRQEQATRPPDGITWSQLGLGRGKTRTLTGATGTKIWVRMATVRGELQSDWCVPVLVTIP